MGGEQREWEESRENGIKSEKMGGEQKEWRRTVEKRIRKEKECDKGKWNGGENVEETEARKRKSGGKREWK